MANVSTYFTWDEVTRSNKATELGITNKPGLMVTKNIILAASKLDFVRAALGAPIKISSWYRCEELNTAVGGSKTSAHTKGWAVDCTAAGMTPYELCRRVIGMGVDFDQIIYEYGRWMHISFDPANRKEVLSKFEGPYKKGLLTESEYFKQVGPK